MWSRHRTKILAGFLASALCAATLDASAAGADPASDDFERATLGSNWTVFFGSVGIANNSDLGLLAQSGMGGVSWSASAFSSDQFSEAVVSLDKNPNMLVQVYVRRQIGVTAMPRYGFHYNDDPAKGWWEFKYDGTPSDQTRILARNLSAPPYKAGDTLRVEVWGANPVVLRGFHNGVEILTALDTAPSAIASGGQPGMAYRLALNGSTVTYPTPVVESWKGGSLVPSGNRGPVVSAGPAQSVVLPSPANLDGTVADDGLPNPPGAVSVQWTVVSGPATVTFSNAMAIDTSASFSTTGAYVLRLSAGDGVLSDSDDVTITVTALGLVAHWKLDEASGTAVSDASGNNQTGTLLNGGTWTAGKIGGALSLEGTSGHVRINDSVVLSPARITVAAWIYRTASGGGGIVSKRFNYNQRYACRMEIDGNGNLAFGISTDGTSGTDALTPAPALNQWTHVAGTFDGATVALYVDGVLKVTAPRSGNLYASSEPFLIGKAGAANLTGASWPGRLDDVRLYNRALSASEISALARPGAARKSDWDGDGKEDILLHHPSSGDVNLWMMK